MRHERGSSPAIHLQFAVLAVLAAALLALVKPAPAGAGALEPRGDRVFFGISDTGDSAQFGEFSTAVSKHPAIIETFRSWGSDFPESIQRWQTARARPMLHITTVDSGTGVEVVSPAGSQRAMATTT